MSKPTPPTVTLTACNPKPDLHAASEHLTAAGRKLIEDAWSCMAKMTVKDRATFLQILVDTSSDGSNWYRACMVDIDGAIRAHGGDDQAVRRMLKAAKPLLVSE